MRAVVKQALLSNVRRQKVVVEYHDSCGPEWMVMFHTGDIQVFDTSSAALKEIQRAAARRNISVTLTTIEWRGVPDGFKPPQGQI